MYRLIAGAIVGVVALVVAYEYGAAEVREEWDLANKTRKITEDAAVIRRQQENAQVTLRYEEQRMASNAAHEKEMDDLRRQYAASGRLRVSAAICGGAAKAPATESAGGSATAAAGTWALPESYDRDIKSLMLEADTAVEGFRLLQGEYMALHNFVKGGCTAHE